MIVFRGNDATYRIDLSKGELRRNGVEIHLPPKAWKLLVLFVQRPAELFSKDSLIGQIWPDANVNEDTLTATIHKLREALGDDPHNAAFIATVHGRGYKFVAPIDDDAQQVSDSTFPSDELDSAGDDFAPFQSASEAAQWVRCHGTKFEVPTRDVFWNSLPTNAQECFWLVGNSNKSWLTREPQQSAILGDAIVRICLNGGSVCILSGTDETHCIARTRTFLRRYVFNERKGESPQARDARLNALIAAFTYSVIDGVNYRAVVSDNRALIIPLLNTLDFRDESMVIELTKKNQPAIFKNYRGDIERLRETAVNYFPDQWTEELTGGRVHYLRSADEFLSQLKPVGIIPRDLVFYLTSSCNLRCRHCYVGNSVLNLEHTWPLKAVSSVIQAMDLDRLTLVGGEPLLYPRIDEVLGAAASKGISERRLTTNLTFLNDQLVGDLQDTGFRVSVSLDGTNAKQHDAIRGSGQFERTIANMHRLVAAGVELEVTHTVTPQSAATFSELVELLRSIGIRRLNLHKVSPQGNAQQNRQLIMSASEWRTFLAQRVLTTPKGNQPLTLRYPLLFATQREYEELTSNDYHHHAVGSFYSKRGHRLVLYATGEVFVSSEAFGTDCYIGRVVAGRLELNETRRSEMNLAKEKSFQVSDLNNEIQGDDAYPIPLSFSYRLTVDL